MEAGLNTLINAEWETALLVCSKCSKRLGGGFGNNGKQSLAKALRKLFGIKPFRKAPIGIVEVKCLGVCPRGSVTLVHAASMQTWHLVPAKADLGALAQEIGLGNHIRPSRAPKGGQAR